MFSPRDNIGTQAMFDALPQDTYQRDRFERAQSMGLPDLARNPFDVQRGTPVTDFAPTSPFGATNRTPSGTFTPTSPFGNGMPPASSLPARSAPTVATPPDRPIGALPPSRPSTTVATPPSRPVGSLPAAAPMSEAANLAAAYSAAQYAPAQNVSGQVAPGTQELSRVDVPQTIARPSQTIQQQALPPVTSRGVVAPRQVTPYTPPAPTITPEEAAKYNMSETVPGLYMPNVAPNPAQVLADQARLVAANPLQSIGKMVAGTILGGVFHSGLGNIGNALGNAFGNFDGGGVTATGSRSFSTPSGGTLGRTDLSNGNFAITNQYGVTTTMAPDGTPIGSSGGGGSSGKG
jgi:hypothetical protein